MKLITISNTYSFFGNFSKLNQLDKELSAAFEGWQLQTGKENLPNGVQANVLRFSKENKAVTIKAYRMDFEFGVNKEESEEEFIKFACDAANKVNTVLGVKGQRIAFSCVEFVEDEGNVLTKANEIFNISGVYGSAANELNVRVNHVKQIGSEQYNSIVIMQDGQVTNNRTNEKMKALFINKDVNTVIYNREERFSLKDSLKYLSDMMLESKERSNTLLAKLEK